METAITKGIKISVETMYQPEYSRKDVQKHVFAYRITIENMNDFPVKLLRRHWHIFDSNGTFREVEGEGVIGVQPLLNSGETHQYVSGCSLDSDMGKMHGTYLMNNEETGVKFRVSIPVFQMITPFRLN